MNGLLDAYPLIACRLADISVPVYSAESLADVDQAMQKAPCVHVIFGGYRPASQTGGGIVQTIVLSWLVVVAVRSSAKHTLNDEAGPVMSQVLQKLLGFRVNADHTPLKLSAAPAPRYLPGRGYFPLAFSTTVQVRGTP